MSLLRHTGQPGATSLPDDPIGKSTDSSTLLPTITCEKTGPWLQLGSSVGFEWTVAELPIPGLPAEFQGLRILHVTDFHTRRQWDPAYDHLIQRIQNQPPDLILFTGDFVDYRFDYRIGWPNVSRILQGFRARLGVVAILGNHDGDLPAPAVAAEGVTLIDRRRLCIVNGSAEIELIGLAGVDRYDLDLKRVRAIPEKKHNALRIALSHYPDTLRKTAFLKPDLFLTGHTHGGQICLPGRIPILRHDSLPRQYCTGIHRVFGTWLISNRGFGFSSMVPLRLFCPAEVVEIHLKMA